MKQSFSDRLFQKTDVRSFYGQHTKLRKLPGKDECKGLCPLHEEKTPSFSVNIETGAFYCFGCTEGGGPVQFEAKRLGISAKEAAKLLAEEYGISRKGAKPQRGRKGSRSGPTPDSDPQPSTANSELRTKILSALLSLGRPSMTKPSPSSPAARSSPSMPEALVRILADHRADSECTDGDDFVFCRADGSPLDPDSLRRLGIYPALKRAGIPFVKRASGCHAFRHLADRSSTTRRAA